MMRNNLLISCRRTNGLATQARSLGLLLSLAASFAAGESGGRMELDPRLQYDELTELASRTPRAELSCQVTPEKPSLGFDLPFHSDYHITIPVRVLANAGGWLKVAARVMPLAEIDHPAYSVHRIAIPGVSTGKRGELVLAGGFDLGPGRYRVDWIMSDANERVCLSHWDLEAKAGRQDLPLTLGPNQILDAKRRVPAQGPQAKRDLAKPLQVKLLLNLSPSMPQESLIRPEDSAVLLLMLRSIISQPGISLSTLVAFNLRDQKIFYRQDHTDQIDFLALKNAAQSPKSGTIDVRLLRDRQGETHFLTRLLADELGAQEGSPDAIVIVGSRVQLDTKVSLDSLKARGPAKCPVFYLNYNSNPTELWSDTIGSALKAYKSSTAFNIMVPRDMGSAVKELLSRIPTRSTS